MYELIVNGLSKGVMEKFTCYDRLHEMGAELTNELYTISYNAIMNANNLFMVHSDVVAVCRILPQ